MKPAQLEEWQRDRVFQESSDTPERIRIKARVEGGDGKTRDTQEKLVKSKGLTLPPLEDLPAAFVAHYVATGEPLFVWDPDEPKQSVGSKFLRCSKICYALRSATL